jgi:hypothetical protein
MKISWEIERHNKLSASYLEVSSVSSAVREF